MKYLMDIKADLKQYANETEKKISLWKEVKRVYKKDGSDFQSFGRNFTGCKVEQKDWGNADDMELVVSDWTPSGGYVKDSISIKVLEDDLKETPAPDRVVKYPHLRAYVLLTPSEMETAISGHIEVLEKRLASYREQFLLADRAYQQFREAIDNALKDLKGIAGEGTSLYYDCREYMKTAY